MAEKEGCVQPAKGPITSSVTEETKSPDKTKEAGKMLAKVGGPAPDFEAAAYIPGKGFKNVKLSDYKKKWVVVCFYPGDFTFV